jgi:hypothetical protein
LVLCKVTPDERAEAQLAPVEPRAVSSSVAVEGPAMAVVTRLDCRPESMDPEPRLLSAGKYWHLRG